MTHGDDKGLVLPPNIAPVQVVVIPIIFEDSKRAVLKEAGKLAESLGKKFRTETDLRDGYSAGWKFNEWEMKGVPLRIEIGPKDIKNRQAVLVRRDNSMKKVVKLVSLEKEVSKELEDIQKSLFARARAFLRSSIVSAKAFDELEKAINGRKMAKAGLCDSQRCEDSIQDRTAATVRLIAGGEKPQGPQGKCVVCGRPAKHVVYVAKQY
jgi:prolyl-tRNA synthetase